MKIRLVSEEQIKKAYKKGNIQSNMDLKENLGVENTERIPEELFKILGETLSFIDKINKKEEDKDENK